MINTFREREGGHLFEEVQWYSDPTGAARRGILVADSMDKATLVDEDSHATIMEGAIVFTRGYDSNNPSRVLQFVPNAEGVKPMIVDNTMLSAPGKSGI